jgi:hypothetical protein
MKLPEDFKTWILVGFGAMVAYGALGPVGLFVLGGILLICNKD